MRIDALREAIAARLAVIAAHATLQSAAAVFLRPHVGLVVVCDEEGTIAGVISKSDLVRHLASEGAADAPVATRMSRNIVWCRPEDDLHDTWKLMAARNLQNIPVLNAGLKPLGILDVRDALKALFEQEEYEEALMSNYIAGVGYQ